MVNENRMICDNHLDIQMDADNIVAFVSKIENIIFDDDLYDPNDIKKIIQDCLNQIHINAVHAKSCAKNAMRQGQRMEKRLLRYRRAIQGLGFERKEKV